eukprot:NODE_96_length_21330_cov_0.419858.p1 type:complete len:2207 gc:universal NODE_96_length_21330_cov_0.419858:801-7421(+)
MEKKRKNCHAVLSAKFSKKQHTQSQLYELPVEHARKIIKDRADMKDKKFASEQTAYLQALKYMPHAIMKLWETIPMPWENQKQVKAIYHVNGALTMVNEIHKVAPPVFMAQWGCMWVAMRREKRDRKHFKRIRFPCFDDEEPIVNFSENIMDVDPLEAVQLDLDDQEDESVIDWIYEPDCPMTSGNHYRFDANTLSTLYRLASPLTTDIYDLNYYYLFNDKSFLTSKALNVSVPSGPKFEPLYPDLLKEAINEDWNEFNDLKRVLIRHPIREEYKIAFPHLYNQIPKSVEVDVYHYPVNLFNNEAIEDGFVFDNSFNPINTRDLRDPWDEDILLNEFDDFSDNEIEWDTYPFLSEYELYSDNTNNGLSLYHAPWPFTCRGNLSRPQDVPVIKNWYLQRCPPNQQVKTRVSYQKLLKNHVKNQLKRKTILHNKKQIKAHVLRNTKYFQQTRMDWIEAGTQLLQQGHNMLNILIERKELQYLNLDYNFNLKPIKAMSTKERKRSRFGNAFHLIREMLKLTKLIVDAHIQFRLGNCDAYQLADGIQYIFSHVGHLTGIYRYKYKIMKQIRLCKDLKHLIYHRFNNGPVGKGPGCGFWLPMWRVWINFSRGITPLLERWLGNILSRHFEGRQNNKGALTVSKQRIEAQYDLELRASVLNDLVDMMPHGVKQKKTKIILQHLSEAWRCYKADIVWDVKGMPVPITNVINKYIKLKAEWWISTTEQVRNRIAKGATCDKTVVVKNLGRLTRLYLKQENKRQTQYLQNGPYMTVNEGIKCYECMVDWLDATKFNPIPFPPLNYKHDSKLLVLGLEKLREAYNVKSRLNQQQREEVALIEDAYDNPNDALTRIKRLLLTQRTFKSVGIEFLDLYSSITPMYDVDPLEKITDVWLDQYLWYEADKRQLFPNFIKPNDNEPQPMLVYKYCQIFNEIEANNNVVVLNSKLHNFYENMDLSLLNKLLRLIMDPNLADYITSKNNIELCYKDMSVTNHVGVIRGLQFSSFVVQYYGLMLDLLLVGPSRALELRNMDIDMSNNNHPIMHYMRFIDQVYVVFNLNSVQTNELLENGMLKYPVNHPDYNTYSNIKSFGKQDRMRLLQKDVMLGKCCYFMLNSRLPVSICTMQWSDTFPCVYSRDNPNILFNMCGFDVRIHFNSTADSNSSSDSSTWPITRDSIIIGHAILKVSESSIKQFSNRMRQILMSSGGTTFLKVVQKWNTALLALIVYYREAILNTPELLDLLIKSENRVQNRIKMGLNSKMPNRFPPVVFYTPKELGGLGMLSIGHILIPSSDLRGASTAATHFRQGLSNSVIPNIFRYITPWYNEITDSTRVWTEYAVKRQDAKLQNRRITLDELQDLFNRGIPRINTLFQKDRHVLGYDRGYRIRLLFKQYSILRVNPFNWTDTKHDGKLWNILNYRTDMIEALGGVQVILEHTLYKATRFTNYEGLFWEKSSGFEESMKGKKLTNAQRSGLNQIPNRRFTLWWSPTINRSQVYIGYLVQLDLTGIHMTGKIPNLKISYIQIFRGHLWQKIHESLVMDICQVLDMEMESLDIATVTKETLHPRKSYKMNSSCADISMTSNYEFNCTAPCYITDSTPSISNIKSKVLWVDVQLRWGDYDMSDINRYCRTKYLDYSTDNMSIYPSNTGLMVCIDLCYNTWSVYGNWIPGMQVLMNTAMQTIIKHNPALFVLQERIRKALQLYNTTSTDDLLNAQNYTDLFNNKTWFLDDTNVYRVNIHKSSNGSMTTKPINGALAIINPINGQLYLGIFHSSTWHNQPRVGQLSKWKVAECVSALIKSLPIKDQPQQLIVTRKGMLDALEVHLLDFPNITIKGTLLQLPFHSFTKLSILNDTIMNASKDQLLLFNTYDDWMTTMSPYTCFSRLILILRAMHVNTTQTISILNTATDNTTKTLANSLFPLHSTDEWIELEVKLKELIIEDYGLKNAINTKALTQTEIRDIILGSTVINPSIQRQEMVSNADTQVQALAVKTFNVHGEEMIAVTTSKYEQEQFNSKADWRSRMNASIGLIKRSEYCIVTPLDEQKDGQKLSIPRKLVQQFIRISDIKTRIIGLMYGESNVEFIVMVPQYGNNKHLELSITSLEMSKPFIGIITTIFNEPMDVKEQIAEITGSQDYKVVEIKYIQGGIELSSKSEIELNDLDGYYMVPMDSIWHYNFNGSMHRKEHKYGLKIDVPMGFYDGNHRRIHFSGFDKMETVED